MVLLECSALLIERVIRLPMLQAQVIVVVEFSNPFFPRKSPGFEFFITTSGIEEVPTDMSPAECEQDGVGQSGKLFLGTITIADDDDPLILQTGKVGARNGSATMRIEDKEYHGGGSRHPQIPATAHLVLQVDKDLPAGLVIVKQGVGHLFLVEPLHDRFEQWGEGLQTTGDGAGRDRKGTVIQIL